MATMGNSKRRGRAKINLGISLLFGVGVFVYFGLADNFFVAVGLGTLVVLGGIWEYRRTMQDIVAAERFEAKAESDQRKRRN